MQKVINNEYVFSLSEYNQNVNCHIWKVFTVYMWIWSIFLFPVCNCSPHGSVRSDCEQMSGKCICKPGISGDKCDTCPDGTSVTLKGCEGCKFQLEMCVNDLHVSEYLRFT